MLSADTAKSHQAYLPWVIASSAGEGSALRLIRVSRNPGGRRTKITASDSSMTIRSQGELEPCGAPSPQRPSAAKRCSPAGCVGKQSADSGRHREDSDKDEGGNILSWGNALAVDAAVRAFVAQGRTSPRCAAVSRSRPPARWGPRPLGRRRRRSDDDHLDTQGDQRPHRAARIRRRRGDEGRSRSRTSSTSSTSTTPAPPSSDPLRLVLAARG